MECLDEVRTELPVCSFSGSLVPHIYRAAGISEEHVPRGLCSVVPWLPSWGRALWAPGTVSPCPAELFPWISGVIPALGNHSGCLASEGCQGMTSPRAVPLGRVTMPLGMVGMSFLPVGKEEVGTDGVQSVQCGVPRQPNQERERARGSCTLTPGGLQRSEGFLSILSDVLLLYPVVVPCLIPFPVSWMMLSQRGGPRAGSLVGILLCPTELTSPSSSPLSRAGV